MEDAGDPITNDLITEEDDPPPYPFSHCYMNIDGFMCCNRFLESLMRKSFRKLQIGEHFHECSVQKIANKIQSDSEHVFNTTFETVVGIDDFAIRAHFAGDLMCKIQEGGRFITNYATMMPSRIGVRPDPLAVVTNMEINTRDGNKKPSPIDPATPNQLDGAVQHVQVPDQKRPRIIKENIPFHEKSREDIENDNLITRR
ncbi:ground-like domain protein [Teladorsagia circumcincta]|uniref:Ground-like domain protein n=1 Tax=Teladorsagia circumcincta TaxID=45464 RepID=A0A2G9UHA1_TELCI|nr:ground-like domain protein [Teladorsagia circumcincta]